MIVIGGSLGSMKVLQEVLHKLTPSFPVPIAIALHRHKDSDDSLVQILKRETLLPVTEVLDKESIEPGHIFVGPPDYHLFVEGNHFSLSTDELVRFARPSIDVLFESAADTFGSKVIGVILTGANEDGAIGAMQIKKKKGIVIVQNPVDAESPVMPAAAIRMAKPNYIAAVSEIGPLLVQLTQSRSNSSRRP